MAWENLEIYPQVAVERAWVTWEAVLSRWGLVGTFTDTNSILFPSPATQATIPSVFGVAIGPYSDIDRCFIQWNLNLDITTTPKVGFDYYTQKLLSVGGPLSAPPLSGPISIVADTYQQFSNNFVADDGSATITPFTFHDQSPTSGTTIGTVSPRLHVIFYLQQAPIFPLMRHPKVQGNTVLSAGATSVFRRAWPIMGRRRVRVTVWNFGADAATIRFGVISNASAGGGTTTGQSTGAVEATVATIAALAGSAVSSFVLNDSQLANAAFMSCWVSSPGSTSLSVNIEATD